MTKVVTDENFNSVVLHQQYLFWLIFGLRGVAPVVRFLLLLMSWHRKWKAKSWFVNAT